MIRTILERLGLCRPLPDLPPLHVNEAGWLEGEGVTHIRLHASWRYARLSTPDGSPRALVWHASATAPGTALTMARRRTVPRSPEDRAASWHISIEADGSIVQMASAEVGCWHAVGQIRGVGAANRVSVGIELIGYEKGPWPAAQVDGARRVARALVQSYGIRRELAMVPHAVIDSARRTDPGSEFMKRHAPGVVEYAFARVD
jgi:N-acetylmuramoyl-L-alanine amidase